MSAPATSPAYLPSFVTLLLAEPLAEDWRGTFRSMASDINVRIDAHAPDPQAAFEQVVAIFESVHAECTRFDTASDLMRANAASGDWYPVGEYCYGGIVAAARAHAMTDGLFDPRVLRTLCELGYDRSLPFASGELALPGNDVPATPQSAAWMPGLDAARRRVRIGNDPIDLGGIGKGLALRWAAEQIAPACPSFLLEAGGDCYLAGAGPEGDGWHVGVDDPQGGQQPLAVLAVRDAACATSSIRLRKWTVAGKAVHHLVDPRTGAPGGAGLLAVTVVDSDPADAEVWSKVLFLRGRDGIAVAAERYGLAALWVGEDGELGTSPAAEQYLIWRTA